MCAPTTNWPKRSRKPCCRYSRPAVSLRLGDGRLPRAPRSARGVLDHVLADGAHAGRRFSRAGRLQPTRPRLSQRAVCPPRSLSRARHPTPAAVVDRLRREGGARRQQIGTDAGGRGVPRARSRPRIIDPAYAATSHRRPAPPSWGNTSSCGRTSPIAGVPFTMMLASRHGTSLRWSGTGTESVFGPDARLRLAPYQLDGGGRRSGRPRGAPPSLRDSVNRDGRGSACSSPCPSEGVPAAVEGRPEPPSQGWGCRCRSRWSQAPTGRSVPGRSRPAGTYPIRARSSGHSTGSPRPRDRLRPVGRA